MKKIILGLIMFLVFFGVSFAKEYNHEFYTGDFGYMYKYILEDNEGKNLGKYINVNGKVYGPYSDINNIGTLNDGKGYYFYVRVDKDRNSYTNNDEYYLNINGKIKKVGEEEIIRQSISTNNYVYSIKSEKVKELCSKIEKNKKDIEIQKQAISLGLIDINSNKYCDVYKVNFSIKGKNYGPYILDFNPSNSYVYVNKKGDFFILDSHKVLLNGKILDSDNNCIFNSYSGKFNDYGYLYYKKCERTYNEKLKTYVDNIEINVNGKKFNISGEKISIRGAKLYKNQYLIGYSIYSYKNKKEEFFYNVNGKVYGPYENIATSHIHFNSYKNIYLGKYGFVFPFVKNGYEYINVNGKMYGPYTEIKYNSLFITKDNFIFGFWVQYEINKKTGLKMGEYINKNGKNIYLGNGGLDGCEELKGGKYICIYHDEERKEIPLKNIKQKYYVDYNGKIIKTIEGNPLNYIYVKFAENNGKYDNYLYLFRKWLNNGAYININYNGQDFGPYNGVSSFKLYDNGYYYSYRDFNGKNYLNVNGKNIFSSEKSIEEVHLFEENNNYKFIIHLYDHENNTGGEVKIINLGKKNIKKIVKINKSKPNPKLDRILNNFFAKIDKKGEVKAQAIYKKIIKKIDTIISKTKSSKKKNLLEYIKLKIEEKLK